MNRNTIMALALGLLLGPLVFGQSEEDQQRPLSPADFARQAIAPLLEQRRELLTNQTAELSRMADAIEALRGESEPVHIVVEGFGGPGPSGDPNDGGN